MPTPCVTCHHPERTAIDAALVLGNVSVRSLGKRYGMDRASLARHRGQHVSPALARVAADRAEAGPVTALARVQQLYDRAHRVLDAAEGEGKAGLSLAAIRELRQCAELLARLTHELDERPQLVVNLAASPEWLVIRATVFAALGPHPQARQAVAGALAALPAGDAA